MDCCLRGEREEGWKRGKGGGRFVVKIIFHPGNKGEECCQVAANVFRRPGEMSNVRMYGGNLPWALSIYTNIKVISKLSEPIQSYLPIVNKYDGQIL